MEGREGKRERGEEGRVAEAGTPKVPSLSACQRAAVRKWSQQQAEQRQWRVGWQGQGKGGGGKGAKGK